VAALLVIALHTGIYSGQVASAWLGIGQPGPLGVVLSRLTVAVPVFFVLSGYLLFRPYAEAGLLGNSRPPTGRYLWHRALRILPVYWLTALTALLLFSPATLGRAWPTARTLLLLHIYQTGAIPRGLTQTWSLATEVAFYALLPLFALALHPLLRRPVAAFAALGLLEAVSLVWDAVAHLPGTATQPVARLAITWLPAYLGYFAAGMALALVSARAAHGRPSAVLRLISRRPYASWGIALLCYAAVSSPLTGSTARYQNVGQALAQQFLDLLTAVALVAPTALVGDRGPARLLARPVPAWLGRISYGIFLWHMVVVEGWLEITDTTAGHARFAVLFPAAVVGTVALAALSHYLVERPVRRLRGVFSGPGESGESGKPGQSGQSGSGESGSGQSGQSGEKSPAVEPPTAATPA
jgi:peptidoglycan/LPS O-acetylase OafA/YrhL